MVASTKLTIRGVFPVSGWPRTGPQDWEVHDFVIQLQEGWIQGAVSLSLDAASGCVIVTCPLEGDLTWAAPALGLDRRLRYWKFRLPEPAAGNSDRALGEWESAIEAVGVLVKPSVIAARRFLRLLRQLVPRFRIGPGLHAEPTFDCSRDGCSWIPIRPDLEQEAGHRRLEVQADAGQQRIQTAVAPLQEPEIEFLNRLLHRRIYSYRPMEYLIRAREEKEPALRVLFAHTAAELAARDVVKRSWPAEPHDRIGFDEIVRRMVPDFPDHERLSNLRKARNRIIHRAALERQVSAESADEHLGLAAQAMKHLFAAHLETEFLAKAVEEARGIPALDPDGYSSWWDDACSYPKFFLDLDPSSQFEKALREAVGLDLDVEFWRGSDDSVEIYVSATPPVVVRSGAPAEFPTEEWPPPPPGPRFYPGIGFEHPPESIIWHQVETEEKLANREYCEELLKKVLERVGEWRRENREPATAQGDLPPSEPTS